MWLEWLSHTLNASMRSPLTHRLHRAVADIDVGMDECLSASETLQGLDVAVSRSPKREPAEPGSC